MQSPAMNNTQPGAIITVGLIKKSAQLVAGLIGLEVVQVEFAMGAKMVASELFGLCFGYSIRPLPFFGQWFECAGWR